MNQDNFSIVQQISQSPTASVYKAYQKALERVVLLKVLHKHLLRDRSLVARFSREARSCATLHSDNIVQIYDLTEIDGAPAIVMEYVEGKSLEELLLDPGVRSEELLLNVAVSVLTALSYSHERGIIHRDIKPGNILVSDTGTIKVTDFGLASVADAPVLTMEGSLIGTPAYMSPEQARGEPVDARSDLFSLGVTLVEVLTGQKILLGESYSECMNKIQNFKLDSLKDLENKCSANVLEFLKRLLAPDKNSRFDSSDAALEYLTSFLGKERVGFVSRRARRRRKNLTTVGIAGVIVIAVVMAFVLKMPGEKRVVASRDSSTEVTSTLSHPTATGLPGEKSKSDYTQEKTELNRTSEAKSPNADARMKQPVGVNSGMGIGSLTSATPDSGYISIGKCEPWAKIYIDSAYAGQTPLGGSMKVPVGRHRVTFSNPYFTPIVKVVAVQKRLLSTVDADFLQDAGYLYVTVEPWGKVLVDDNFRESTPTVDPIAVSSGTRIVRVQNPHFTDIVRSVTVKPGDTLKLKFSFLTSENK